MFHIIVYIFQCHYVSWSPLQHLYIIITFSSYLFISTFVLDLFVFHNFMITFLLRSSNLRLILSFFRLSFPSKLVYCNIKLLTCNRILVIVFITIITVINYVNMYMYLNACKRNKVHCNNVQFSDMQTWCVHSYIVRKNTYMDASSYVRVTGE
jgi:hypothetical protein